MAPWRSNLCKKVMTINRPLDLSKGEVARSSWDHDKQMRQVSAMRMLQVLRRGFLRAAHSRKSSVLDGNPGWWNVAIGTQIVFLAQRWPLQAKPLCSWDLHCKSSKRIQSSSAKLRYIKASEQHVNGTKKTQRQCDENPYWMTPRSLTRGLFMTKKYMFTKKGNAIAMQVYTEWCRDLSPEACSWQGIFECFHVFRIQSVVKIWPSTGVRSRRRRMRRAKAKNDIRQRDEE